MVNKIINIGIKKTTDRQQARLIRSTNILLLILMVLTSLLLFPVVYEDGWGLVAVVDIISVVVFGLFISLNYWGYNVLSRVLTSLYPSITIMCASIIVKILEPYNTVAYNYFDARILLIGLSILPLVLFSYKEKAMMYLTFGVVFIFVIAFDPIHDFFEVGYIDFYGSMPRAFWISTVYMDIVFVFVNGALFYFKVDIENLLSRNVAMSSDLAEKNMELSVLFNEIEESNLKLKENETIINNQKDELTKANSRLVLEVTDKSEELKKSNNELVKHNNDLQQFSNTLSHNLRGPVANLLGLSNLFSIDNSEESRKSIADHIHKSANALDVVIKDLNKIVELRNNLFQIKEKINIIDEIDYIWLALDSNVKQCGATLKLDIQAGVTYGVRSYFHSILYNLVSNALKYRSPERPCIITVSSKKLGGKCVISVKDNGIGVDLEKHGDKIFGMYKRFHTHLEGKGLGLFLTKQQIESMGGTIDIESTPNVGTKFTIRYQEVVLSAVESQLFYGSDVANIYLDVVNLITTLIWKRMPTPDEFKEVFTNNIEVFSSYNSDKWIIKLELLKEMPEKEKQWILDNAIDTYASVGVKIIAVIRDLENSNQDFWEEFSSRTAKKSLEVFFADSFEKAKEKLVLI